MAAKGGDGNYGRRGLSFFYPNRLTKWRDYGVLFFYPNRAAMSAQQHQAVKSPQYVLQYGIPAVGALPRGPPLLKCYGGHTVELVDVWRRERGGLWPLVV